MSDAQKWLDHIAKYDKAFSKWEKRASDIVKLYRDDNYTTRKTAKMNILWSNVQTLIPAVFARLPKPDVSRRFRDNDPVGRVAGLLLERALDFEVQHYPDYRDSMAQSVTDRFLGGRGVAWVRYEPHIRAEQLGLPEDGTQVSEDAEAEVVPEMRETLEYECTPCDYVHYKDFGHTIARTWEEVTAVWRKVYLTREACIERFGKKVGESIPCDTRPEEKKADSESSDARALVYEIWDKDGKKAYWLAKSLGKIVDEKDDPLGLESFFPCARPLFATMTNETLVPVPDYTLYQDQASSLDVLAERIDGLIRAMQVKGVYNAEFPALARLFTEAGNNDLIPINNFAAFAEKNGLAGAIDIVDLKPIYEALRASYEAVKNLLDVIYNITGIADIIRGQSQASETATAQQIKGQYAGLRLGSMKTQVAQFATELLQIKAQIICAKYDPQTLLKIAAADQLSSQDQQLLPDALALLKENPLRSFRIEVAADSLIQIDESQEKQDRTEFVTAIGGLLKQSEGILMQAPDLTPLVLELIKFSASAFKVGRGLEGLIDETAEKIKQAQQQKAQQPPPPSPEMMKIQADQQQHQAQMQMESQQEQMRMQAEAQAESARVQADYAIQQARQQADIAIEQQRMEMESRFEMERHQREMALQSMQAEIQAMNEWRKAILDAQTKVAVAEISAGATLTAAQESAADNSTKD